MSKVPKGWKKIISNNNVVAYSKKNYVIYIWHVKEPKEMYVVEPFRKLANYKRRLFRKEFSTLREASKFAWSLMRQKEIRGYYVKGEELT